MTKYRAAYFTNSRTGQETVLTYPDQASLSDDDLMKAAVAEAISADIVDAVEEDPEKAYPRLTMQALIDGLNFGLV